MNKFLGLFLAMPLMIPVILPSRDIPAPSFHADPVETAAADIEELAAPGTLQELLTFVEPELRQLTVSDQHKCLAQAVYFEARSEPLEGQLAVAQVVLNRVRDARYPSTVCHVVFQNEHWRNRCQFSFACDGRSDNPKEARAWRRAQKIAFIAATGRWNDLTEAATHYHADYVNPYWKVAFNQTAQYGRHVFYRDGAFTAAP